MRLQHLTVLLAILTVTGCTSATKHYRVHGDGPSLYRLLHDDIRSGQRLEEVRSRLGPGNIPCDQERVREVHLRMLTKAPQSFPYGVKDTDRYVDWQFDGGPWITLQFRDNRLVNHLPQEFSEYKPFTAVAQ